MEEEEEEEEEKEEEEDEEEKEKEEEEEEEEAEAKVDPLNMSLLYTHHKLRLQTTAAKWSSLADTSQTRRPVDSQKHTL